MNIDISNPSNDYVEIIPVKLISNTINVILFENDYEYDDGIIYDENGNNYNNPQKNKYDEMLEEYEKEFSYWEKLYLQESTC